ncbi:MAG: uncharacterized protein K0R02_52 [Rickettsiaceae bacterium]|jgi:O-6-methylguanine DNA methyltransferase|nr:uncharacterized protein [Rickettsiaceae bacterium]
MDYCFKVQIMTHQEFAKHLKENETSKYYLSTPATPLLIHATSGGIYKTEFVENADQACIEELPTDKLLLVGTEFQVKVWQAALTIPKGKTWNYHELATQIGHPRSYRAVANALGKNNIAYLIPCHRIVRKDGTIGGFSSKIQCKAALIDGEKLVSPSCI